MEKTNYINKNSKRILAVILIAMLCSVATSLIMSPLTKAGDISSGTMSYEKLRSEIRNEVNNYLGEKNNNLTGDDTAGLKEKISSTINDNTDKDVLGTQYRSDELERIIRDNIEKSVSDDRTLASHTADDVIKLLERIDSNDKAYADLARSYENYRDKMDAIIKTLVTEKDLDERIEDIRKLYADYKSETDKRLETIDSMLLSNQETFNNFASEYNAYKASIESVLDTKASVTDLSKLEESFKSYKTNMETVVDELTKELGNLKTGVENNTKNITALEAGLTDRIYPVGSVYLSVGGASPETMFGGKWQKLSGNYLYAADDSHGAGTMGGANSIKLNANQIPSLSVSGSTGKTTTVAGSTSTGTAYAVGHMRVVQAYDPGDYDTVQFGASHVVGFTPNPYTDLGNGSNEFPGASHAHSVSIPSLIVNSAEVAARYTNNSQQSITIEPTYISVNMWKRIA